MRYRNVSDHLEDLADGRAVDPGGYFEMDEEQASDQYNKSKMDEGSFIEAPEESESQAEDSSPARAELQKRAKELDITGTSRMRNDEIQTAIHHAEEEEVS